MSIRIPFTPGKLAGWLLEIREDTKKGEKIKKIGIFKTEKEANRIARIIDHYLDQDSAWTQVWPQSQNDLKRGKK